MSKQHARRATARALAAAGFLLTLSQAACSLELERDGPIDWVEPFDIGAFGWFDPGAAPETRVDLGMPDWAAPDVRDATAAPELPPPSCPPSEECAEDWVAFEGGCHFTARPDGTPCDDGDECTIDDRCHAGGCTGTRIECGSVSYCVDGMCASPHCQPCVEDADCWPDALCEPFPGVGRCLVRCPSGLCPSDEQMCRQAWNGAAVCFDLEGICAAPAW